MRMLLEPEIGDFRYYIAFDTRRDSHRDVVEEDVIYGLYKVDFTKCHAAYVEFHNEISAIDLLMREVTQAEWETYVAFELFPVLYAYDSSTFHEVEFSHVSRPSRLVTTYKVRFRDY